GAGRADRPLECALCGGSVVQPADLGARSRDPDRRRLYAEIDNAGRPVPVVAASGSGGAAGKAEEAALKHVSRKWEPAPGYSHASKPEAEAHAANLKDGGTV